MDVGDQQERLAAALDSRRFALKDDRAGLGGLAEAGPLEKLEVVEQASEGGAEGVDANTPYFGPSSTQNNSVCSGGSGRRSCCWYSTRVLLSIIGRMNQYTKPSSSK